MALIQKIRVELQQLSLIERSRFVGHRGSSNFGSAGVTPASLPLPERSLRSCECNVLPTASQPISKFIAKKVLRATE
jgi:hypothetical protein